MEDRQPYQAGPADPAPAAPADNPDHPLGVVGDRSDHGDKLSRPVRDVDSVPGEGETLDPSKLVDGFAGHLAPEYEQFIILYKANGSWHPHYEIVQSLAKVTEIMGWLSCEDYRVIKALLPSNQFSEAPPCNSYFVPNA